MKTTAMKVAAGVGVVAGTLALMSASAAQAALPDLNWSVAGESSLGVQGTVISEGTYLALTGKYAQGASQYSSSLDFSSTGSYFSYDYTFDLQKNSKVNVSVSGASLNLGGKGFPVDVPNGVGGVAVGPSGNGLTSTETLELFKYTGGNLTQVGLNPTSSTGASAHGIDTLTYANLAAGNYILVVVGSKTTPGVGQFSGSIGVSSVPLPGAVLLFGSAVLALGFAGHKIRGRNQAQVG